MNALNPLSDNPTKWSNTLKQFVGNSPTNCLSVFDRFMRLPLKELKFLNLGNLSYRVICTKVRDAEVE